MFFQRDRWTATEQDGHSFVISPNSFWRKRVEQQKHVLFSGIPEIVACSRSVTVTMKRYKDRTTIIFLHQHHSQRSWLVHYLSILLLKHFSTGDTLNSIGRLTVTVALLTSANKQFRIHTPKYNFVCLHYTIILADAWIHTCITISLFFKIIIELSFSPIH